MDGFEGKTERARYDYPFAEPPAVGATLEVAPGVRWVRMPLPFSLKWINLWLIEEPASTDVPISVLSIRRMSFSKG